MENVIEPVVNLIILFEDTESYSPFWGIDSDGDGWGKLFNGTITKTCSICGEQIVTGWICEAKRQYVCSCHIDDARLGI